MTEINTIETATETQILTATNAIDAALAKVKSAGRPKVEKPAPTPEEVAAAEAKAADKAAAREAESAAKKAAREAERAQKLEVRSAKRAEKAAAREAERVAKKAARDAAKAFQVGQAVKVVTGELAGIQGLVTKCSRKRVFLSVEGQKKPAYVFITDCAAI